MNNVNCWVAIWLISSAITSFGLSVTILEDFRRKEYVTVGRVLGAVLICIFPVTAFVCAIFYLLKWIETAAYKFNKIMQIRIK